MEELNKAKELFRDIVDVNNYIALCNIEKLKKNILHTIKEKEKMIFLYGKAGSGKSMLLKALYNDFEEKNICFISNPCLDKNIILSVIKKIDNEHYYLFIDEAQLLDKTILENLRMVSDEGNLTILFATHNEDLNNLLQKEHFKSRVNSCFQTHFLKPKEIEYFINAKLMKANLIVIAEKFDLKHYKMIYKYTNGSLRRINQFMFKFFDVLDFFYNKYNNKIFNNLDKYFEITYLDFKDD